jgi:hypothetical protein
VIRVLALKAEGRTDREVSRLTGIPVTTMRLWRRRGPPAQAARLLAGVPLCPTCGSPEHDFSRLAAASYTYLLGVYLGDGCLSAHGGSWSLRITLDKAYPGIIAECRQTIAAVRGRAPSATPSRRDGSVVVASTWKEWSCLFPQHGAGKKHERSIQLADWQRGLVARAPGSLLRGLIHTDGWRGTNRVVSKGKTYEYPRYQFSNRSDDIRRIFTDACDALGVEWRAWTRYHVSVAKGSAVAKLDAFVGPKSQPRRPQTPDHRPTWRLARRVGATMQPWTCSPSTPSEPRRTSANRWKLCHGSTASA